MITMVPRSRGECVCGEQGEGDLGKLSSLVAPTVDAPEGAGGGILSVSRVLVQKICCIDERSARYV